MRTFSVQHPNRAPFVTVHYIDNTGQQVELTDSIEDFTFDEDVEEAGAGALGDQRLAGAVTEARQILGVGEHCLHRPVFGSHLAPHDDFATPCDIAADLGKADRVAGCHAAVTPQIRPPTRKKWRQ